MNVMKKEYDEEKGNENNKDEKRELEGRRDVEEKQKRLKYM